ncbi:MAG: ABC transporter substrate-binding protein [Dehalococcoidia bacterium]|nr:ABC transporter substrate-binding protein [Dehalococcoidia bacterium]
MRNGVAGIYQPFLRVAIIAALVSLWLACGQAEAPTPTPTATPTKAPAATATPTKATVATPTPTAVAVGPVATPTPTLVATPTSAAPVTEKPRYGGTLEDGLGLFTPSFDGQFHSGSPDYFWANAKLYSNLLINYEGQKIECDICSEWHLANGNKTMVFTLIPGIKFHTGQELTSEDVKYSIRMMIGDVDGIISPRSGVLKEFIESIETPSKYEVRVNLVRPSLYVPKVLGTASSMIYRAGTTRADLTKAPAGSGPFLIKEVVPGASWKFERNPNYFKPGLPYIDKINQTTVADINTRVAAFLTHRIDFWITPTRPADQYMPKYQQLRDEGKVNSQVFSRGTALHGVFMNVTKPPFDNLKVRQAVNLVLDRPAFGKVYAGERYTPHLLVYTEADVPYGRPANQVWDVLPGWGTGAKKQQEVEQAKRLAVEAGYPNGLDNIRQTNQLNWLEPELLQQELRKLGIRTNIETYPSVTYQAKNTALDYSVTIFLYRQTTSDPDEIIGSNWVTGGARNLPGYSNPEVDKLYIQMSSEIDPAKKVALFRQIEDIIIFKDQGYAPTPDTDVEGFWWKRLQGVTIGMAMHVAGSSGNARGDRWWLKD